MSVAIYIQTNSKLLQRCARSLSMLLAILYMYESKTFVMSIMLLTRGPKSTASLAITSMYIFMRIGAKKSSCNGFYLIVLRCSNNNI
jgi:hypothetical protein